MGYRYPAEMFTPDAFDFKSRRTICTWNLKPPSTDRRFSPYNILLPGKLHLVFERAKD